MADETIIMTPATAQPLSFESEGNAGYTHEDFRETFAVENFRRRGRLEDSICTADELVAIADASRYYLVIPSPRIEDGASRRERVGQYAVS